MHFIQKHILDKLRTVSSMRYTQLNSIEVESGHFRYHLNELIRNSHVAQIERGLYGLTPKGQAFVDKLSEKRVNASPMPKVITYTLLKDENVLLLQKKPKQPYMGLLNMIGGKLHEGELAVNAATREVKEKTGLTIQPPNLKGIFEIIISTDSGLYTHVITYVFIAEVSRTSLKDDTIMAIPTDEVTKITNLAPDFLEIYDRIHASESIQIASLELSF